MPRPNRTVVGLCIAVIVLAACLSGVHALDYAAFEPHWVLLPDEVPVAIYCPVVSCDEQPLPLLSVVSSRAPPPTFFA